MAERNLLNTCLDRLAELPFIDAVDRLDLEQAEAGPATGCVLALALADGQVRELAVQVKHTNLTHALAEGLIARARRNPQLPLLVVAPKITRGVGRHLGENGVNYVDPAGNCWLRIEDRYMAVIEGRRAPAAETHGRGLGAAGYQVIFALLAMPDVENATVREIARQAGTAPGTATRTLQRLEHEGFLLRDRGEQIIRDRQGLLERWLHGYQTQVRPRWLIGRFRTRDEDPNRREARIADAIAEKAQNLNWAWGGGAGAMRMTGSYHGPDTVLLVKDPPIDLPWMIGALPAPDGPLFLMEAPTELALAGSVEHVANPLLVYTELLAARDERAREAAEEIHRQYLQ